MKINNGISRWIAKNQNNLLLAGLVTFTAPKSFVRSYLENNRNKCRLWGNKKACVTISFDCDYPRDIEVIPQIIKNLQNVSLKTSFACVGYWIKKFPREHMLVLENGHEIVNHTYSHPDNELLNPGKKFRFLPKSEKKEEIEKCHDICKKILKYKPKGCRIPHFKNLFSEDIYEILKELGYSYSSSTWLTNTESFGLPFKAKHGIIEFPLSTCPKHPFTVFDTWHSFNSKNLAYRFGHRTEQEYIDLFRFLIDLAIKTNSYVNIYIDPYDVLRLKNFMNLMRYVESKKDDLWIATYEELVKLDKFE